MIFLYIAVALVAVLLLTPLLLWGRTLRNATAYVEATNAQFPIELFGQDQDSADLLEEARDDLDEKLSLLAGIPKSSPFRTMRGIENAFRDSMENLDKEDPPKLQKQQRGRDVVADAILFQVLLVKANIRLGRSPNACLDLPTSHKILRGCWIIKVHLLADPSHHPNTLAGFKSGIIEIAQSSSTQSIEQLTDQVERLILKKK